MSPETYSVSRFWLFFRDIVVCKRQSLCANIGRRTCATIAHAHVCSSARWSAALTLSTRVSRARHAHPRTCRVLLAHYHSRSWGAEFAFHGHAVTRNREYPPVELHCFR